jgi:hypothetical protein
MKDIARELRSIMAEVEPQFSRMNHDDVALKPAPDEWSKKEILGHLIDSAANNHQRFVRTVNKASTQFIAYEQNEWVKIQRHNERPWASLVALWAAYNDHLSHVIECIPEDAQLLPCDIGEKDPAPLDFVIEDYLRHLRHHLKDILGEPS